MALLIGRSPRSWKLFAGEIEVLELVPTSQDDATPLLSTASFASAAQRLSHPDSGTLVPASVFSAPLHTLHKYVLP